MSKIISKSESSRKKVTFSCDTKIKEEFDELRKKLEFHGKRIVLTDEFEKVMRNAISDMKKAISSEQLPATGQRSDT